MFKQFLLGAAMLFSVSAFAQEQNKPAADVDAKATSEVAQQLALANQLVKYGYDTKTALPLIQAVQIYKKLNVTTEAREKASEGDAKQSDNITKTDVVSFDEAKILEDATTFAAGNKNLLALISEAKKASRSPERGVLRTVERVKANSTDVYNVRCLGGQSTEVLVSGDGDTDLDLYVYDENGNLIVSDLGPTDDCIVSFTPRWTGPFRVKVKNRGNVYNQYTIVIF